jgi:hypothetical protein
VGVEPEQFVLRLEGFVNPRRVHCRVIGFLGLLRNSATKWSWAMIPYSMPGSMSRSSWSRSINRCQVSRAQSRTWLMSSATKRAPRSHHFGEPSRCSRHAARGQIRDEGPVGNKAVYVALGVTANGAKDILGLWIENTEGPKFCCG